MAVSWAYQHLPQKLQAQSGETAHAMMFSGSLPSFTHAFAAGAAAQLAECEV